MSSHILAVAASRFLRRKRRKEKRSRRRADRQVERHGRKAAYTYGNTIIIHASRNTADGSEAFRLVILNRLRSDQDLRGGNRIMAYGQCHRHIDRRYQRDYFGRLTSLPDSYLKHAAAAPDSVIEKGCMYGRRWQLRQRPEIAVRSDWAYIAERRSRASPAQLSLFSGPNRRQPPGGFRAPGPCGRPFRLRVGAGPGGVGPYPVVHALPVTIVIRLPGGEPGAGDRAGFKYHGERKLD